MTAVSLETGYKRVHIEILDKRPLYAIRPTSSYPMQDEAKKDSKETPGGGKLTKVLTNLEELWDESQYEEAFNVDTFVSSLK